MRSAMLLLATVFLFACHNSPTPPAPTEPAGNPLDELAKYSYLITTIQKDAAPGGQDRETNNGSGFFIRDTGNRLFLVTAYHVTTQCNLLNYTRRPATPDSLKVWYINNAGLYTFQEFSLKNYVHKPCNRSVPTPDLDTMDVTGHFRDATIYSIERLAPHFWEGYQELSPNDSLICFGFPDSSLNGQAPRAGTVPTIPWPGQRKVVALPEKLKYYSTFYTAITPRLEEGFSGAAVFKIKGPANHFEFAGIQAFADSNSPTSLIVQGARLSLLVHWK